MKGKFSENLVDRLVVKTMAAESPKAQIFGGKAACATH
jgi:hypothetical protein